MTLELIPNNELLFEGPFTAVAMTTLKLSNNSNDRMAYKIKTTAPRRYCVKPNSGFLDAHAIASVQVMLQPITPGQSDDRNKHKFMVQWAAVPSTYTDDVDNFWKLDLKGFTVQDSKLKCMFIDKQTGPVEVHDAPGTHDTEQTNQRANESIQQTTSSNFNERSPTIVKRTSNPLQTQVQQDNTVYDLNQLQLKQRTERLRIENIELNEKIREHDNELRSRSTAVNNTSYDRRQTSQQQQNTSVLFGIAVNEQIILVAFVIALLLGFSLGYFLFSCSN